MLRRRWWDMAGAAGAAVIAVALVAGFGSPDPVEKATALGSILLFVVGYVVIARPAVGRYSPWRFWAFLALMAVALGVGTAAVGYLAILQCFAYPLVWVLADSRRRGIVASIAIAVAVFAGFAVGGAFSTDSVLVAATTAAFSGVFAIALGLWISSIAEYGEERAHLVADLTAAQREVEALSRDRGAAEERERVSRDIHDTLAQTLAGLVLLAERAGRQSREDRVDDATATIGTVEQVARDALDEARALVARTSAVPREPAFGSAIARLVDRFRTHSGAEIALTVPSPEPALERDTQVVLLRCLQEALSNVSRHADARTVAVGIELAAGGSVVLRVADDGRGFDPGASRNGVGLDGMADRVALAGGTFDIASDPGSGTRLTVILPATVSAAGVPAGVAEPVGGRAASGSRAVDPVTGSVPAATEESAGRAAGALARWSGAGGPA